MHTLTELGVLIRREGCADPPVLRCPGRSAIPGAVNSARRNSHEDLLPILRVENDCVQGEAAIPGHPPWAMRMIEQSAYQRPALAPILSFKQCRRFHSAVKQIRPILRAEHDLPDVLE